MAPGTLQLFPPPERPLQRPLPPKWPSRTTSRRDQVNAQASGPTPERIDNSKSQVDFHELIIRVNSAPNSPAEIQVPTIEAPQRARLANPKTPPQQSNPAFEHAPRSWGLTVTPPERPQGNIYPVYSETVRPNYSQMRNASQAPGDRPSAQNDFGLSPISPMNQNGRGASPTPYADHGGAIGIAISSESPTPYSRRGVSPTPSEGHYAGIGINVYPASPSGSEYGRVASPEHVRVASPEYVRVASPEHGRVASPEHGRVASPAYSEAMSARSGSPTLVRSNSAATAASRQSPARGNTEPPVMRSIFPRFNPGVPLAKQSYLPMITAPPSRIPRDKIHRPLNLQTYTPHSNIESIEDDDPAPRASAVMPYYTPPTALDSLWDAANGQGIPMVQVYTLQIHRKAARTAHSEAQLIFGPSESQPFYTLSHTSLAPDLLDEEEDDADHELLITRHNPSKPSSLPISHFALSPTPSLSPGSPNLPGDSPKQSCALITTIYPKMAAITALDAAAQSPAASRIALTDPDATSPAAERLAQDVLLGTAQRECCALVWTRAGFPQPAHFISACPGTYALHHPSLGVFPITHEGDITPGLSPILGTNPFSSSRQRPRRINKPTRITILNPFATPPEEQRPDTPSEDGVLARLDFGNDSLVLNVAAILRLGNPYLIDVIVSALLAVALAEEKRVRREIRFEAPPMPSTPQLRSESAASQDRGKKGFWYRMGKRAEKKVKEKVRTDSAIGLVEWAGPPKEGVKNEKEEDMPFVTTAILGLLTFTFKTTVWVLGITIKIVAGVVVKVSHWVVEKA